MADGKKNEMYTQYLQFYGGREIPTKRGDAIQIKPAIIDDYNRYMGGVDMLDQFRSYYTVGRTG